MKTSNHSGGTLGGMSDGSQLILRAAIKPTPSISQMQHTVNNSGEEIKLLFTDVMIQSSYRAQLLLWKQ